MLRRGCVPEILIDWEQMHAYSHRDIFCARCSISMVVLPQDPTTNWEYLQCHKCNKQISKDTIIDAFQAVEQLIEQELNVAIQLFNGILLVESIEFIGTKRRLMRPKLLSPHEIETVKDMFTHLMKKQLEVAMDDVIDLWQK
jgi:hypothetical protein